MFLCASLLSFSSCSVPPHPFHHVRARGVSQDAQNMKVSAEQDLERIGHIQEAMGKEIEDIREAGASTARAHFRAQKLGKRYGIK
jgi:hypothetical protein